MISSSCRKLETYNREKPLYEVLRIAPDERYSRVSIFDLGLSGRAQRALGCAGLDTLHLVLSSSIGQLKNLPGLGALSVEQIISRVQARCGEIMQEQLQGPDLAGPESVPVQLDMPDPAAPGFSALLDEYMKLNPAGQKIALETLRALTSVWQLRRDYAFPEKDRVEKQ